MLCLVFVAIKSRTQKTLDDQQILKLVEKYLEDDSVEKYEVTSIVSLDKEKTTTVIVNTGHLDIALEINNVTGKIISKEKLIR